jgi:hypothetical protein
MPLGGDRRSREKDAARPQCAALSAGKNALIEAFAPATTATTATTAYTALFRFLSAQFADVGLDVSVTWNHSDGVRNRREERAALRFWFFPSDRAPVGRRLLEEMTKSSSSRIDLAIATDLLAWIHRGQLHEIHVCRKCGRVFTRRSDAKHCGRDNCRVAKKGGLVVGPAQPGRATDKPKLT